jgi:hypothetical protein
METSFSDYMREVDAASTPEELALREAYRAHHRQSHDDDKAEDDE